MDDKNQDKDNQQIKPANPDELLSNFPRHLRDKVSVNFRGQCSIDGSKLLSVLKQFSYYAEGADKMMFERLHTVGSDRLELSKTSQHQAVALVRKYLIQVEVDNQSLHAKAVDALEESDQLLQIADLKVQKHQLENSRGNVFYVNN